MPMKDVELTRKELYDLVWSMPLIKIARKFQISDNGIKKRCKKYNIPLPGIGHWRKVELGYTVSKAKLPKMKDDNVKIEFSYRREDPQEPKIESPFKVYKTSLETDGELDLSVPSVLTEPDKIIQRAYKSLNSGKYQDYHCPELKKTAFEDISIMVSSTNIDRAAIFLDTLIKLLRKRKHTVQMVDGSCVATVDGEKFSMMLREKRGFNRIKNKSGYDTLEYYAKGILVFTLMYDSSESKEWVDTKTKIEQKLIDILSFMEVQPGILRAERIERERQRLIWEEKERLRRLFEQKKEADLKKFKKLIDKANYWKQAMVIREYIEALIQQPMKTVEQDEYIRWARQKIDWFDPSTCKEDELLGDNDRSKLIDELKAIPYNLVDRRYFW